MEETEQIQQEMSPEQAADWARLQADAQAVEDDAAAQIAEQEQQQAATLYDENTSAIVTMLDFAVPVFEIVGYPSVKNVLTTDAKQNLAGAWAAVATKRGYSLGSLGFAYKEELAAAFLTYTIGKGVIAAVREDAEARKKAEQEAKEKNKITEAVQVHEQSA